MSEGVGGGNGEVCVWFFSPSSPFKCCRASVYRYQFAAAVEFVGNKKTSAVRLSGENLLIYSSPHAVSHIDLSYVFVLSFTPFNTKYVSPICYAFTIALTRRNSNISAQHTPPHIYRTQSIRMENSSRDGFFRICGLLYIQCACTLYAF